MARFGLLVGAGIISVSSDWRAFKIIAARLDSHVIVAQSIPMTSDVLFTTLSLGLGVASSIQVGRLLGSAASATFLPRITVAPYGVALLLATPLSIALLFRSKWYACIFTSDREVARETTRVIPSLAVFQFLDLAAGGTVGVLRGASIANTIGYYTVGLPRAWFLDFRMHCGLRGLWAGIIAGTAMSLGAQMWLVWLIGWSEVIFAARGRIEARRED